MSASNYTKEIIQSLVHRAKEAQKKFEKYNQEQVDEVVTAVAWALCNPKTNKLIPFQILLVFCLQLTKNYAFDELALTDAVPLKYPDQQIEFASLSDC